MDTKKISQDNIALWNEAVFQNITETDSGHFEVFMTNNRARRLNQIILGVKLRVADYQKMILDRQVIGPFTFVKKIPGEQEREEKFESLLGWAFSPSLKDQQDPKGFLEGGKSRFIQFTKIPGKDPNTKEDILELQYSVLFPSIERTLSKVQFGKNFTIDELIAIVDEKGPGLKVMGLISKKKPDVPYNAILKYDVESKRVVHTEFLDKNGDTQRPKVQKTNIAPATTEVISDELPAE